MESTSVWNKDRRPAWSRRRLLGYAGAAGVAGLSVVGCSTKSGQKSTSSSASGGGTPATGGIFNDVGKLNPPSLDPQKTPSAAAIYVGSAVLSRLFRFKAVADPATQNIYDTENDLGVSAESPDATTWTIKLRPDARFHNVAPVNGHAVEAEDIKVSFARALSPGMANRGSLDMIDINTLQTPDAQTVVFKLKYPYADFVNTLSNGQLSYILPREIDSPGFDTTKTLIGSGPFLFESFTPDVAITFKKNPDWFEKGRPYVDGVKQAIITDPSQALAQFTGGNVGTASVTENDLDTMRKSNPNAPVLKIWGGGGSIVYFQMGDPNSPFQDIRVRRAASLAIDRAALGKSIWNDHYQYSFNVERTSGTWALDMKDLDPATAQWYKYDLAQAKSLLTAAGLSGNSFKIEYPTPPQFTWSAGTAQAVSNMLSQLPWKISLSTIDFNKDYIGGGKGARYGNYPPDTMIATELQASTTADDYIYKNFQSTSTSSASRTHDPQIDAMLTKERTIVNNDERMKAMLDLQRYIAGQMYTLAGLPHGYTYTLVAPNVRNYLSGDAYGVGTGTWAQLWLAK